jgi:hypothetical protein
MSYHPAALDSHVKSVADLGTMRIKDCEYRAGIAVFKTPRQTDTLKAVHDFSLNALEIVKFT